MTKLANPVPLFLDGRGTLLDGGYVYVGAANTDAENPANWLDCYWDAALTIPAEQPFRTLGGVIINGGNTGFVFFAEDDNSLVIKDVNGVLVSNTPSTYDVATVDYQPLDADLTAIAGQANTPYGLALLTLANTAALKAATGIPDCLPLTGGTVTSAIIRSGGGNHPFYVDATMNGGRIFITAAGVGDPTSLPGDLWFTYS